MKFLFVEVSISPFHENLNRRLIIEFRIIRNLSNELIAEKNRFQLLY